SSRQKRIIVDTTLANIYSFNRWNEVLTQLNLKPISSPKEVNDIIKKARRVNHVGESIHHKKFKEFISKNPQILGIHSVSLKSEVEYIFPSADCIDVSFKNDYSWIGVEVKSHISDDIDITRGLFQCVKYKSLMEAQSS